MALNSIGDLSHTSILRRHSVAARLEITDLSQELSTGLKNDRAKAVGADFSALSAIERALTMNESYRRAANEARIFLETAQAALISVQESVGDLGTATLTAANSGDFTLVEVNATDAKERMIGLISNMNASAAGRRVFGGNQTDVAPLAEADVMLDALRVEIAGLSTASDYDSAIDAWFAPGGGFESVGYLGSIDQVADITIGANAKVSLPMTANDDAIRDALKSIAKIVLLPTAGLGLDPKDARAVLNSAAEDLLGAQHGLSVMSADVGSSEEAVENAFAQINASDTALQISRGELLAADPYETATRLEQINTKLETLYLITARVSNLKLTDFLR